MTHVIRILRTCLNGPLVRQEKLYSPGYVSDVRMLCVYSTINERNFDPCPGRCCNGILSSVLSLIHSSLQRPLSPLSLCKNSKGGGLCEDECSGIRAIMRLEIQVDSVGFRLTRAERSIEFRYYTRCTRGCSIL